MSNKFCYALSSETMGNYVAYQYLFQPAGNQWKCMILLFRKVFFAIVFNCIVYGANGDRISCKTICSVEISFKLSQLHFFPLV